MRSWTSLLSFDLADPRSQIRYHHDGKYNVLAHDGPLEIFAERPKTRDFASVRAALARVVPLCLDQDPRLVPLSTLPDAARARSTKPSDDSEGREEGEGDGEGEECWRHIDDGVVRRQDKVKE